MLKKVGITFLFILICAVASLVLMEVFNETTEKIKGFYYVEDNGGERDLNLGPGKEGRTISDKRLDKPIVVDEYLLWFVDPFSGEIGSGKRLRCSKEIRDLRGSNGCFPLLVSSP